MIKNVGKFEGSIVGSRCEIWEKDKDDVVGNIFIWSTELEDLQYLVNWLIRARDGEP